MSFKTGALPIVFPLPTTIRYFFYYFTIALAEYHSKKMSSMIIAENTVTINIKLNFI